MGSGTKLRHWESFNDVALERKNTMKEGNAEEEESQCCGNPRVFFDDVRAEKICRNCGTVLKEREPIASLSTNQFKARNQNGNTRKKYSKKNLSRDLQRALKLDRRTYDEKRIIRGIKEIKRIGSIREIPEQLQQHAIELFKKTMERVKNKFIS